MNTILRVLLAASLCFSTGCASMFSGTSDTVHITSTPPGCTVYEGDKKLGTTPLTVALARSTDFVTFEHAQYGRREVPLNSDFQVGYLFLDILFTPGYGLIGILVDTMTQAWWDHPAVLECDLTKPPEPKKKPISDALDPDRFPGE